MTTLLPRLRPLAIAATCAAAAGLPATASAAYVQLGQTSTPVAAPQCPSTVALKDCTIVEYESTALETSSDGTLYPTTVNQAGVISSFQVGVSGITSNKQELATTLASVDKSYGGDPEVAITVLRQVGKSVHRRWSVAAESQPVDLKKYLGEVVDFPLVNQIPVVPGEVVALTVPTWAPVLSYNLDPAKFAYRQSRAATSALPCRNYPSPTVQLAQQTIGATAVYGCPFAGTRVEYSATEVTTPTPSASFRRAESRHPAVGRGHRIAG